MGQISITINGSFGRIETRTFGASTHGHANAIAEAISFLSTDVLPDAIALDHELHSGGDAPGQGWLKRGAREAARL
jgi:hypothetical protein